jgi:hypothetical protein
MTLPDERYRAIHQTREFLIACLNPKETPRLPKAIRHKAYYLLKHFPTTLDLDQLEQKAPKILHKKRFVDPS